MPRVYDIQNNFARGEMSPRLHARTDIDHYRLSLLECTNWYVLRQGSLRKRQATEYISTVKDQSKATRLVPFVFSTEQAYMLEFGDLYFRPYANGARITDTPLTITGATQANPVVLSVVNSLSNGDKVFGADVAGMTEINNREFTVANQTGTTIELSGEDGTGHTAYGSGGTVARLVEFATPYLEAELFEIQFAQSADTLYVAHKNHPPQKIGRTSDTTWTVTEIDFEDGPFLDEPENVDTTLTPSDTGNIIPVMTSNSAPAPSAVTLAPVNANAFLAADRDPDTRLQENAKAATWTFDIGGGTKTCTGYTVRASDDPTFTPAEFRFEGFDGAIWVTLDTRSNEVGWADKEERFYDFDNATAYEQYRLNWDAVDGGTGSNLTEVMIKESPDTMSAITLTASAVTGINEGQGFLATDVGRSIRLRAGDGVWRWYKISTRSSSTVVTGKLYGKPLRNTDPISNWKMGAWSAETGYPASVSFFEERLVWARTNLEPQKIWGSKTFGFEDHGISSPLVDDDAFTVEIASNQVNEVKWLSEAGSLIIGTSDGIRTLGPSDTSRAFSTTNLKQARQTKVGSSDLYPAEIGNVAIFADRFNMALHELVFSFESNAFTAPELSIISDHLIKPGITALTYAQSPDSLVWISNSLGELIPLTFERDQRIVGMTRCPLAGGSADTLGFVESVASIPGSDRSELWLLVKRTINGGTVRYIERLSAEFEDASIEDARFLDSYLERNSGSVTEVSGLGHLEGETVGILADGLVVPDQTVTDGKITLTTAATNISVGLRYQPKIRGLRVALQARDGSLLGRRFNIPEVIVDVDEAQSLKVGRDGDEKSLFKAGLPDEVLTLQTGTFRSTVQGSWDDGGIVSIISVEPLPATIRGIIRGIDFEP